MDRTGRSGGSRMPHKFKVLALANRLQSFTVDELAKSANVHRDTVSTVLGELPDDAFDKMLVSTGRLAGRDITYSLRPVGEEAIEQQVKMLFSPSEEPVKAPENHIPLGLRAAKRLLEKLQLEVGVTRSARIRQIVQNLETARNDLTCRQGRSHLTDFRQEKVVGMLNTAANSVQIDPDAAAAAVESAIALIVTSGSNGMDNLFTLFTQITEANLIIANSAFDGMDKLLKLSAEITEANLAVTTSALDSINRSVKEAIGIATANIAAAKTAKKMGREPAPAGSEVAVKALREAIAAATSAFGSMSKTAKQFADVASATTEALKVVGGRDAPKKSA